MASYNQLLNSRCKQEFRFIAYYDPKPILYRAPPLLVKVDYATAGYATAVFYWVCLSTYIKIQSLGHSGMALGEDWRGVSPLFEAC